MSEARTPILTKAAAGSARQNPPVSSSNRGRNGSVTPPVFRYYPRPLPAYATACSASAPPSSLGAGRRWSSSPPVPIPTRSATARDAGIEPAPSTGRLESQRSGTRTAGFQPARRAPGSMPGMRRLRRSQQHPTLALSPRRIQADWKVSAPALGPPASGRLAARPARCRACGVFGVRKSPRHRH